MELHIEINADPSIEKRDGLGVMLTRSDHDWVGLTILKRSTKARGSSKLAYQQGIIP